MQSEQSHPMSNIAIMKEALSILKGFKGTYWLALIYILLITFLWYAIDYPLNLFFDFLLESNWLAKLIGGFFLILTSLVQVWILFSMKVGLWMIAIEKALSQAVNAKQVFSYFSYGLKVLAGFLYIILLCTIVVAIAYLIPTLLVWMGLSKDAGQGLLVLLVLSALLYSCYLFFAYQYFVPVLAEKKLSVMKALQLARKTFKQHKNKFFGFYFLKYIPYFVLFSAMMLPFFSAFIELQTQVDSKMTILMDLVLKEMLITFLFLPFCIWIFPLVKLADGIFYREMFIRD